MGEDLLHTFILEVLRPLVARWLASRGRACLVGADQFIYWEPRNATRVVAPDIYVLPGVSPQARVRSWKVWETGVVPSFTLEVVSGDRLKDYEEAPRKYAQLGVEELVLFDPEFDRGRDRQQWQVYRRPRAGGLVLAMATDGDRVRSKVLGCFLRAVGDGTNTRIRVGTGVRGEDLFPTDAEIAQVERGAREAERRARETAEAELARVRAELERRRRR